MARKEPAKGVHGSPEKAGEQNLANYNGRPEDEELADTNTKIYEMFQMSIAKSKAYKGLWNEEDLTREITEYFQYCSTHNIKTAKAGLRLWLAIDKTTYWEWETKAEKYGYKSHLIRMANDIMESQMIGRAEKYPTANIFLLKSSHGHIEASKLDITTNGNDINNAEDVKELVSKLGLDKK